MVRDQILAVLVQAAQAAEVTPDLLTRLTPILVAAISAAAAIGTTLIVAMWRKPDCQHGPEIDRLERMLWQHGIDPATGSKVTPP